MSDNIREQFEKALQSEQSKMKWSSDATEHEKTLVYGNCLRVAEWAFLYGLEVAAQEADRLTYPTGVPPKHNPNGSIRSDEIRKLIAEFKEPT